MYFSYFDATEISERNIKNSVKKFERYRKSVQKTKSTNDSKKPEYALA